MDKAKFDPSLNFLLRRHQRLDYLFSPKTVAVIGASERENSVGKILLWNLLRSPFGGTVYPVNLTRDSVLGIVAYKSISEVPESVDLAVIATPAKTVPDIIAECASSGVKTGNSEKTIKGEPSERWKG